MGFEIDYIPAGSGERSADAIAMRYGDLFSNDRSKQTVIIIDGGTLASGKLLVEHINEFYQTNTADLVISTHLDDDHLSGIRVVLDKMDVKNLLMHLPWEHESEIEKVFVNKSNLKVRLQKSFETVSEVEGIALDKEISIYQPFSGLTAFNNTVHILGPSRDYYDYLLPKFDDVPPTKNVDYGPILGPILKAAEEAEEWIFDHLGIDLLNDDEVTSPENNSSAIILITVENFKFLFTGDAGIEALTMAFKYAEQKNIDLSTLNLFHVPHHGSKHNVGSTILKTIKSKYAFVSATGESSKHPSKKVTNALFKHGSLVHINGNKTLRHSHNAPKRIGWVENQSIPFYDKFKE